MPTCGCYLHPYEVDFAAGLTDQRPRCGAEATHAITRPTIQDCEHESNPGVIVCFTCPHPIIGVVTHHYCDEHYEWHLQINETLNELFGDE
jgi:hypothetical protein